MDRWLIAFFTGSILSLFMGAVPEFFYVIFFTSVAIACLLNKYTRVLSGLFFGMAWVLFNAVQYQQVWQSNQLNPEVLFSKTHIITGQVNTIPTRTELPISAKDLDNATGDILKKFSYKFNFKVTHIDHVLLSDPLIIRLNWNKTTYNVEQGVIWNLKAKFKPPHGFANPGGFNYSIWLRQNNIVATGYVINNKNNEKLIDKASYRQQLYSRSLTLLPKNRLSSLLSALSFGERGNIDQETWLVLNKTNTQHLIAISGLHLGLIATGSFFLIQWLIRIFPLNFITRIKPNVRVNNWLITKNCRLMAVFFSCSIAFYYAYLAGFSLPTIRALIMLLLFWIFKLSGIKFKLTTWLFLTVFIIILITPMSLISGSFWLSFYAVCLILLTVWRFKHSFVGKNSTVNWLKSLFWVQLSLSVFMLPISMLFNYQLSLVSIAANLIAVPLMSFTSIPLCLLAVLLMPFSDLLPSYLYQLALLSTESLWLWLELLSQQSFAIIEVSFYHIIIGSLLLSMLGISLFLSLKWRYLNILALLVTCYFVYNHQLTKNSNNWKVSVMDVGQGLSVIIEKNNKAILYDTGASYPSGFNLVDAAILPYLKHKGIRTLDKVIISHSDNDHAGGLTKLKNALKIDEIIATDPKLKGHKKCVKGDDFIWQDLTFKVLWPPKNNEYDGSENDHSCVIKVSDNNRSVLLTGDISTKVEKLLVADVNSLTKPKVKLNADVIVAPHHGSNTSSSQAFIKAVSPMYVVYSAGFMNRWNMPSSLVQNRYSAENITAFNTAKQGVIEINMKSKNVVQPFPFFIKYNNEPLNDNSTRNTQITIIPYKQGKYPFWFAQ